MNMSLREAREEKEEDEWKRVELVRVKTERRHGGGFKE